MPYNRLDLHNLFASCDVIEKCLVVISESKEESNVEVITLIENVLIAYERLKARKILLNAMREHFSQTYSIMNLRASDSSC